VDRLKESCDHFAEKGITEFDKMLNGCRTKYDLDHGKAPATAARNGHRNGSVLGRQDATAEVFRQQRLAREAECARIDAEVAAEEAARRAAAEALSGTPG
jgi:hypothetical protein